MNIDVRGIWAHWKLRYRNMRYGRLGTTWNYNTYTVWRCLIIFRGPNEWRHNLKHVCKRALHQFVFVARINNNWLSILIFSGGTQKPFFVLSDRLNKNSICLFILLIWSNWEMHTIVSTYDRGLEQIILFIVMYICISSLVDVLLSLYAVKNFTIIFLNW